MRELTGSSPAFGDVIRRHTRELYMTCLRILGHHEDAEDALQEVFMVMLRKGPQLHDGPLGPWLHRVATYVSKNLSRARAARTKRERSGTQVPEHRVAECDPSVADEPRETLNAAVSKLPDRYRLPMVLFHYEGRSLNEVADELKTTRHAIRARLRRGRRRLGQRMGAKLGIPAHTMAN